MKDCGECGLCCKVIEVPTLKKGAGVWCQYCTKKSCSIWETRPAICRTFNCMWTTNIVMGEALRPDRCKVVFDPAYLPERTIVANVDEDRPDAWKEGEVKKLIVQMARDGFTVWVMVGKDRHILLPKGETQGSAVVRANRARERVMNGRANLH